MKNDKSFASLARQGELEIGFSAEWLLARLGSLNSHAMDSSLVQAMGLFDFQSGEYWQEWLDYLDIPRSILPNVTSTVHEYGTISIEGADIPVLAMIGDQQAALLGYDCRQPGQAECTHGTASFVNIFLGSERPEQKHINVYHAWDLPGVGPTYCLEADTAVTGAALRWMKEHVRILDDEKEIGKLASTVPDTGGVVFIPAFTGLNVPYHDRKARGTLLGMTLGTTRAHIARAFLEALGFQIRDILTTVRQETGLNVEQLHVGGGVSASDQACQIQADLTGIPIVRAEFTETTARAAALLAGVGAGVFPGIQDFPDMPGDQRVFEPSLSAPERELGFERWQRAIKISRTWGDL
jgi:glycerol kinase